LVSGRQKSVAGMRSRKRRHETSAGTASPYFSLRIPPTIGPMAYPTAKSEVNLLYYYYYYYYYYYLLQVTPGTNSQKSVHGDFVEETY
jgi:hypothetical protein